MSVTQTVEVPPDRRLTIDVPAEVPTGPAMLTFTQAEPKPRTVPVFGCAKGEFYVASDFDAPLDDFPLLPRAMGLPSSR